MYNGNNPMKRRKVLQSSGVALTGLAGGVGVASADSSEDISIRCIEVKEDRVKLTCNKKEYYEGISMEEGVTALPYEEIKRSVKDFNKAISNGRMKIQKENGKSTVKVKNNSRKEKRGDH